MVIITISLHRLEKKGPICVNGRKGGFKLSMEYVMGHKDTGRAAVLKARKQPYLRALRDVIIGITGSLNSINAPVHKMRCA